MTFLDVVNGVISASANDSARRALLVRLLAVLGHEAPPEVWRLKWEGRAQVAYNWPGSPAGDLWLVAGRLHAGLVPKGDVLEAPAAAPLPPPPADDREEDDFDILIRSDPKALGRLRKIMTPERVAALREIPPILIPRAVEQQAYFLIRRILDASRAPMGQDVEAAVAALHADVGDVGFAG